MKNLGSFFDQIWKKLKSFKKISIFLILFTIGTGIIFMGDLIDSVKSIKTLVDKLSCIGERSETDQLSVADSNSFNILILPFDRLEVDKTKELKIEKIVLQKFREKNEIENLGIRLYYDSLFHDYDNTRIDSMCRARKMNLVIFGDYLEASSIAKLKYAVITDDSIQLVNTSKSPIKRDENGESDTSYGVITYYGETENKKLSTTEILNGELNKDVYDVIYMSLAIKSFFKLKNYLKTLDYLDRISNQSTNLSIQRLKRICYLHCNNFRELIPVCKLLCEVDPTDAKLLHEIGFAYSNLRNVDSAIIYYNKSLSLDSKNGLAYFNLGNIQKSQKNNNLAINFYSEALQINPNHVQAYFRRSECYLSIGENQKALIDLNAAIYLNLNNTAVYTNRGSALFRLNRIDDAITDFDHAIELDYKNHLALFNRGVAFMNKNEFHKAILDFEKVIVVDKKFIRAYEHIVTCYGKLGLPVEGIEYIDKLIEIEGANVDSHNSRGYFYMKLDRYKQAIVDFDIAIRLDENYAFAYSNRGYCYGKMGHYNSAFKDFAKSISLDPKNAYVYKFRGLIYWEMKDFKNALFDFETAVGIESDFKFELTSKIDSCKQYIGK